MTDEPEFPFDGLDAERPLPPELRARLETALLAAVADGLPVPADAESLDAPRPLPEPLRARLESALLAEAAGAPTATAPSGETPAAAAAAATPTATARSEEAPAVAAAPASLPAAAAASSSATGRGQGPYGASGATGRGQGPADGGSPAAAGSVVSLESRRRKVVAWWSAVAAVLVLVLGAAGLIGINGDGGSGKVEVANAPTTTTAETPASIPSGAGDSAEIPPPSVAAPAPTGPAATATTRGGKPGRPTTTTAPQPPSQAAPPENTGEPTASVPSTSPQGGSTQPAPEIGGWNSPPPPFYDAPAPSGDGASPPSMSAQPGGGSTSGGADQQGAAPNSPQKSGGAPASSGGPALRIGIIPGDAAQEAAFRAYITRLNQSGGIRDRLVELVTVGPGSPAANTIATVNLGTQPVAGPGGAPSWATSPLLETLTATENLLPGSGAVFSFASAVERQGHLAADALFPADKVAGPGTKAVIYVPPAPGPLRDAVPAAIKAVLKERGVVTVDVVTYDSDARKPLTPADAAFVSLDPAAATAWSADAKAAGYRPAAGVAGIYSLFDEALLPNLPEGARVVSPYVAPGGDEGQAIRSAGSGSASASVLHGWATAKSLAAAMWRTGADTPAEVQTALEGLRGWSSGLAPAYETRNGTRSRTPEGVVFRVQGAAFIAEGPFRKDLH